MPKKHRPRKGSLQFWPRKRAKKVLPSANWKIPYNSQHKDAEKKEGLLGFIGYKAGMITSVVEDLTPNSRSLNEKVAMACTIIECPPMKVFSIRLYKNNMVVTEALASNLNKELKKKVKIPKGKSKELDISKGDDIRLICYTQPKAAKIKKTPDLCEIGINADSIEKKFELAKELLGKEINVTDIFNVPELVDVKGVTKGQGYSGTVKRFGIGLKSHKSEKGQRRPGSLGPWTPTKVSFKAPMAGQLGFFSRIQYNNQIIHSGGKEELKDLKELTNLKSYGDIRNSFLIVRGSLQGSKKRPLLLVAPQRKVKKIGNYKFLRFIR